MKIKSLDTVSAANVPQKLSLRDSFTGEVIRDEKGETWDVFVYGASSDQARNALKEWQRNKDQPDGDAKFVAAIIAGWSSNIVDDDGKPVKYSPAAAIEFVRDNEGAAQQVGDYSQNRRHYDPKR